VSRQRLAAFPRKGSVLERIAAAACPQRERLVIEIGRARARSPSGCWRVPTAWWRSSSMSIWPATCAPGFRPAGSDSGRCPRDGLETSGAGCGGGQPSLLHLDSDLERRAGSGLVALAGVSWCRKKSRSGSRPAGQPRVRIFERRKQMYASVRLLFESAAARFNLRQKWSPRCSLLPRTRELCVGNRIA